MGKGKTVRFLYDDWVGVAHLNFLFLRSFRVVSKKDTSVKECYVWDGNVLSWNTSFRWALRQLEVEVNESLSNILSNVFLCKDVPDFHIWKPLSKGFFSSR